MRKMLTVVLAGLVAALAACSGTTEEETETSASFGPLIAIRHIDRAEPDASAPVPSAPAPDSFPTEPAAARPPSNPSATASDDPPEAEEEADAGASVVDKHDTPHVSDSHDDRYRCHRGHHPQPADAGTPPTPPPAPQETPPVTEETPPEPGPTVPVIR